MLKKVRCKNGSIGYIERYLPDGICIVRFCDSSWGWCKESDLIYLN